MRARLRHWLQDVLSAGTDADTTAPEAFRSLRTFNVISLGFVGAALPVAWVNWRFVGPELAVASLVAGVGGLLGMVWVRRTLAPRRVAHFSLAVLLGYVLVGQTQTGGFSDPSYAAIHMVPMAAALLTSARGALAWSAVCLAATLGFGLATWAEAPAGARETSFLVFFHAIALACATTLAVVFARNHERLQLRLNDANEELKREGEFVRLLHRSTVVVHEATDVAEGLARAVELVCQGLGWDVGVVWLRSETQGQLVRASALYERDRDANAPFRRALAGAGGTLRSRVVDKRGPVGCPDVSQDAEFDLRDAARAAGLRGGMAFPFLVGSQVSAVIELFSCEPRKSDRRLIRLLSHVGTQVARLAERLRAEARIESLAYYDALTGLPNRQLFQDRLDRVLEDARTGGERAALLFLDLDGFKRVNDTLGHAVGDGLLREVTRRFSRSVRVGDEIGRNAGNQAISRLGGDEFTVLLERVRDASGAATVAQRMLSSLERPVEIDGHEIYAGASIGIAIYPEDGEDPEALLRAADAAMYQAKSHGRGQFQFHADESTAAGSRRLQLEGPLRRALQNDQFELHYQPLLDMQSRETIGAEALLRWHEPDLGPVSPGEFIPLAEQCGLINPIGEWIVRAACAQLRGWIEDGYEPVRVAVNVSGQQLRGPALVDTVANALRENDLEPRLLELEITESTIVRDDVLTNSTLRSLAEIGVEIVLDDFGTGYSSLSHLRKHPIDSLKLDRSFVSGLPGDPDDVAITRAVIALAHGLHKRVTAEGIENEEQLSFLREMGCDVAQGFLFSPAVPGHDFVRFLPAAKPEPR